MQSPTNWSHWPTLNSPKAFLFLAPTTGDPSGHGKHITWMKSPKGSFLPAHLDPFYPPTTGDLLGHVKESNGLRAPIQDLKPGAHARLLREADVLPPGSAWVKRGKTSVLLFQGSLKDRYILQPLDTCGLFQPNIGKPPFTCQCSGVECKDPYHFYLSQNPGFLFKGCRPVPPTPVCGQGALQTDKCQHKK